MRIALTTDMQPTTLTRLLLEIHQSIDRLIDDLLPDQPEIALALLDRAAAIPRPGRPQETARSANACRELTPFFYQALDRGALDAREFDTLMLQRTRAESWLGASDQLGGPDQLGSVGSPSDSESST